MMNFPKFYDFLDMPPGLGAAGLQLVTGQVKIKFKKFNIQRSTYETKYACF